MQIEAQDFLHLVEGSGHLAFVDIETTGTKGDYNSILCVSIKPYGKKPYSLVTKQPGNDQATAKRAKEEMEKYLCWVTYYGRMFDVPLINTRLTRWGQPPVDKRHHVDMYFTLKYNLLTGRRSQAHLLRFFDCEKQKMDMSPEEWNKVLADPVRNMGRMVQRCESDTEGLEALYRRTSHLIREIRK